MRQVQIRLLRVTMLWVTKVIALQILNVKVLVGCLHQQDALYFDLLCSIHNMYVKLDIVNNSSAYQQVSGAW